MELVVGNPWAAPLLLLTIALLYTLYARTRRTRRILSETIYLELGRRTAVYDYLKIATAVLLAFSALNPMIAYTRAIEVASTEDLVAYSDKLPVQYIVLVDVSPSMHRENRLEQAVEAIEQVVATVGSSDRVVIAVFGGRVRELYSGDPGSALNILRTISDYTIEYTAISTALGWASSRAKSSGLPSVVVVITDGANNYGGNPVETAKAMSSQGIPVLFIRVGSDPRGTSLFYELSATGIEVVDVGSVSGEALEKLLEKAVLEKKLEVLRASGRTVVYVTEYSNTPTYALLLTALVLLIVLRSEGV
ncbi:MAG: hypothetical protein DRO13_06240 [Thermoprotei archaeon]|nr:MAG: hypothetical protein DRO13_06240 [Thermoprotei archaeon]